MEAETERVKLPPQLEKVLSDLQKTFQENELWTITPDYAEIFSKLIKKLNEIEKFPFSLDEFERAKKCAYEIIGSKRVNYTEVYQKGEIKSVALNKGINDAARSGVEALVNASIKEERDKNESVYIYSGLPVRKAKGKFIRNFLLKYFY